MKLNTTCTLLKSRAAVKITVKMNKTPKIKNNFYLLSLFESPSVLSYFLLYCGRNYFEDADEVVLAAEKYNWIGEKQLDYES